MYQPGKVANPARGQMNRKNVSSLSPFAPENLVLWDGFGPVPRQHARLSTHRLNLVLTPQWRPLLYSYRQPPSGQSRVHQVKQLRTDCVHFGEFTGTGPPWTNFWAAFFFCHTHYWYSDMCDTESYDQSAQSYNRYYASSGRFIYFCLQRSLYWRWRFWLFRRVLYSTFDRYCLKKNLNAPRPSEHPPVRGKKCQNV